MMEDKEFEEGAEEAAEAMEETIHIDEEDLGQDAAGPEESAEKWTEEFVVAGEELVEMVKQLIHEANVRRIIVKNEEQRILLEIPLVVGVVGIAWLPLYASLALIAALVSNCTITVERVETG
jgi:hypothetical protein